MIKPHLPFVVVYSLLICGSCISMKKVTTGNECPWGKNNDPLFDSFTTSVDVWKNEDCRIDRRWSKSGALSACIVYWRDRDECMENRLYVETTNGQRKLLGRNERHIVVEWRQIGNVDVLVVKDMYDPNQSGLYLVAFKYQNSILKSELLFSSEIFITNLRLGDWVHDWGFEFLDLDSSGRLKARFRYLADEARGRWEGCDIDLQLQGVK